MWQLFHRHRVGGTATAALVASHVRKPQSSVAVELGWLAYFLALFVVAVYAFVRTLVPHHFNDKVAVMLAAIFAGLLMIGTRAWLTARWRRG